MKGQAKLRQGARNDLNPYIPQNFAECKGKESVIEWIEDNQIGRRNLTPDQFRLLLGRKYNRVKGKQGSNNQYVQEKSEKGQNDPFQTTAEILAEKHGVSRATVERAGALVESLEQNAIPEIIEKVFVHFVCLANMGD